MRSYGILRYTILAAFCWITLLTNWTDAQNPEIGIHEVSVIGLRDQDASGNLVEGGIRMVLGCRVRFDDETWRLIKQHDKVIREITIETPFLTDDVIRWLTTQEQLRSVKLAPNFFVDSAGKDREWNLTPLESLNRLEQLTLVDMRISDQVWLAIGQMRTLKSLSLYRCRIDSQGSLPLANLKELQSMEIDFCNVDDRFFAGLHELPNLKLLHLGGGSPGKFTAAGLASLSTTNLTQLHLNSINIGSAEIDGLSRISSLQIITGIPGKEASKFEKHPNLLRVNKQFRSAADGSPFVDPNAPGERRWALKPSNPGEKNLSEAAQSSLPNQLDRKAQLLKFIPLAIEPSGDTVGERVREFAGRKDVLKTKPSDKPDTTNAMTLEVPLPDELLVHQPNRMLYFCLSVWPPSRGTARLMIHEKQREQASRFLGDLNKLGSLDPSHREMVEQKDGWMVLRIPVTFLESDTKRLSIKLVVDANSSANAYWANAELQVGSNVTNDVVDPTNQTIFQSYSDESYPYARLIDAATGKVLQERIGIGWGSSKTSCLFARDGSHVAVISRYHDNYRSGSSHFERLWLFALRPFGLVQEASSRRFNNIRFTEDNKAFVFDSSGPPDISGK